MAEILHNWLAGFLPSTVGHLHVFLRAHGTSGTLSFKCTAKTSQGCSNLVGTSGDSLCISVFPLCGVGMYSMLHKCRIVSHSLSTGFCAHVYFGYYVTHSPTMSYWWSSRDKYSTSPAALSQEYCIWPLWQWPFDHLWCEWIMSNLGLFSQAGLSLPFSCHVFWTTCGTYVRNHHWLPGYGVRNKSKPQVWS